MMKISLLQKDIESYTDDSTNLDDLHKILDAKGKNIGYKVDDLIKKMNEEYPEMNIIKYKDALQKIQEYFYRRYVVRGGSSISMLLLDEIDELYFLLRGSVDPDIGVATIDQIFVQKKYNWGHPISAFNYAYLLNKSFKSRKHREWNIMGPDGIIRNEKGE
jgi:hypothetical protein